MYCHAVDLLPIDGPIPPAIIIICSKSNYRLLIVASHTVGQTVKVLSNLHVQVAHYSTQGVCVTWQISELE